MKKYNNVIMNLINNNMNILLDYLINNHLINHQKLIY